VGYGLGVDVGATFTAAAVTRGAGAEMVVLGDRGVVVVPSVVFAREDGTLLAGHAAEARAPGDPGRVAREAKRRMGDPTPVVLGGVPYPPAALLAALVGEVVAAAAEAEGGPPGRVVLTRPALWGPYRQEHFEEVALLSGLAGALTTTEAEAAATYYAAGGPAEGPGGPAEGPGVLAEGAVVAVYDLGGGTFDTAVLRAGRGGLEIVGTPEGVDLTGGVGFDEVVFRYVDEALGGAVGALDPTVPAATAALLRLRQDCTLAKETLSAQPEATIPVFLPDRRLQVTLTRAEFERRIGPAVESTLDALHRALRSAQVAPAELAEVLLVGGSSRIPLVARRLAAELGAPIRTSRHPKHAVALGAAIIAGRAIAQPSPANPADPAAAVSPHGAGATAPELSASGKAAARRRRGRWRTPTAAAAVALLVAAGIAFFVREANQPGPDRPMSTTAPAPVIGASLPTPTVLSTVKAVGDRPQGVAVTADGRHAWVPSVVSNTVHVIDTSSNDVTATITMPAPPQYIGISPDSARAYVTLIDPAAKINTVQVIETSTRREIASIPVGKTLYVPTVSPDGRRVYVPDHATSRVFVIDATTNRITGSFGVPEAPHGVAFTPNGAKAYVVSHETSQVSSIDVRSETITTVLPVGISALAVAVSPDGKRAATANYDAQSISLIDTSRSTVVAEVGVGRQPQSVAYAPDGRHLYVVNAGSSNVSVVDTATNRVTATLPVGNEPWALAVSPDGRRTYVTNASADTVTVLATAS